MNQNEFKAFSALLLTIAELFGKSLKSESIRLWWNALERCNFADVKEAFNEHVQTSRFMPTIAEILDCLKAKDGRPDAEEAWAICAKSLNDEGATIVWTQEMATAFGVALGLNDDKVAARMAFKETYESAVNAARRAGIPPQWTASLGHDPNGRDGPLLQALKAGKLLPAYVAGLLPYREDANRDVQALIAQTGMVKAIEEKAA